MSDVEWSRLNRRALTADPFAELPTMYPEGACHENDKGGT